MKPYRYSLVLALLVCSFAAIAQEQNITLELNSPTHFSGTKGRDIYDLKELQIWCVNNRPDSILRELNYGGKKGTACDSTFRLKVLSRRLGDQLQVCILKRYNPFLENEMVLTYAYDSLKKWNRKNCPPDALPRLTFRLPYCVGGAVAFRPFEMYLFPFSVGFSSNDPCVNDMPLAVSLGRSAVAEFGKTVIYFFKSDVLLPDNKIRVKVMEDGVLQDDRIGDGLVYKASYTMADTLVIGGKLFRIDSIGGDWDKVYMHRLEQSGLVAKVPESHMRTLAPYFEQAKEYVLLDFWGTWCAPCIAGMPKLRALHDKVKSEVPFLSVCFDDPKNYAKAKEIFAENQLSWPQVFNSILERKSTLTGELSVTTFPTYMLVKKNGEIFFSTSGDGFDELSRILLEGK
ncbi:TlpA family protein disulfide reductase [Chitinophaga sp. NPDC101104]|uniref:TlpA family protein disulfide reductase n=1 Tax=Chitinophaga sp. NPDC101104 TaxID=3390561 RepID=UPI003CFEB66E